MNLPVIAVGLFAFFLWQLRRAARGAVSPAAGVDCTTYRHPEWRRGVGQRWIPATTEKMGVVCGFVLVRVDPQTGARIYTSAGGGGDVQTGYDPPIEETEQVATKWEQFWRDVWNGFTTGASGGSLGS